MIFPETVTEFELKKPREHALANIRLVLKDAIEFQEEFSLVPTI